MKNQNCLKQLINNPNFSDLSISFATQYIHDGRVKPLGTADALVQAMNQYPQLKKLVFLYQMMITQ